MIDFFYTTNIVKTCMKKTSSYEEITVSIDINEENVKKISNWELVIRAIAEGEWNISIHEISTGRDFVITAYKEEA